VQNAILIVEFAREKQKEGLGRVEAVLEACRLRLRPILMTSLAFTMGRYSLMLSSGAGSEMRQAIGIAVFFGMLGVTAFGLVLTPVFYVVIRRLVEARENKKVALDSQLPSATSVERKPCELVSNTRALGAPVSCRLRSWAALQAPQPAAAQFTRRIRNCFPRRPLMHAGGINLKTLCSIP